MICVCPYHVGMRWLLTAWNRMVNDADGDDDIEPLTREQCSVHSVCGPHFENAQLPCIEGRCGACTLRKMQAPPHVDATQVVKYDAFALEPYVTKKGKPAKRQCQVKRELKAPDFVTHFNTEFKTFRDHHFKSTFIAKQRDLLWKNCPDDWTILSIDGSANYQRRQQHTLTCQQARSCIIAPIVLQRSADPWTDPSSATSPTPRNLSRSTACSVASASRR